MSAQAPPLPMAPYPKVSAPTEFGNALSFWVEYPAGLVDLTRSTHLRSQGIDQTPVHVVEDATPPPLTSATQWELDVEGDRVLRLSKSKSAIVIVDMQKYPTFLPANDLPHSYPPTLVISYTQICALTQQVSHAWTHLCKSSRHYDPSGRKSFGCTVLISSKGIPPLTDDR